MGCMACEALREMQWDVQRKVILVYLRHVRDSETVSVVTPSVVVIALQFLLTGIITCVTGMHSCITNGMVRECFNLLQHCSIHRSFEHTANYC